MREIRVGGFTSFANVVARVGQTLTHAAFVETKRAVSFRFAFYFTQIIGMFWMATFAARAL